jgi:hypothetical protein
MGPRRGKYTSLHIGDRLTPAYLLHEWKHDIDFLAHNTSFWAPKLTHFVCSLAQISRKIKFIWGYLSHFMLYDMNRNKKFPIKARNDNLKV